MKCVKNKESGDITRIYNERAYVLVRSGKFSFCSKAEWKKEVRDKK
jgi:hypothetical protein